MTSNDRSRIVEWDLRSPKTTKELGGKSTMLASVEGSRNEPVHVRIKLPSGFVISGDFESVSATPGGSPLIGEEAPVGRIQLADPDSATLSALRVLTDHFKMTFGMSVSESQRLDGFLTQAQALIAANGGEIKQVAWGNDIASGFDGNARGPVRPALTIRVLDDAFSTYTSVTLLQDL